jgi:hypothetical protein
MSPRCTSRSTTRARSVQFQGRARSLEKMDVSMTTKSVFSNRYGKSGLTATTTSEPENNLTDDDTTTARVKINYALLRNSVF